MFLNEFVFQGKRICNFRIHLFSFLNSKQTNDGIFSNKTGKILTYKNFLERESPTLTQWNYDTFIDCVITSKREAAKISL